VCMCVYVCMYVCVCVYVRVYVRIYVCMYVRAYMYVYTYVMFVYVGMYVRMYVHTECMWSYTCTQADACKCAEGCGMHRPWTQCAVRTYKGKLENGKYIKDRPTSTSLFWI
jgi:hypothetical protein